MIILLIAGIICEAGSILYLGVKNEAINQEYYARASLEKIEIKYSEAKERLNDLLKTISEHAKNLAIIKSCDKEQKE